MAAKRFNLNSVILLLIYVALALTVLRWRPELSEMTGLSQGLIAGIAVGIFLAIAIGSLVLRRKKNP